MFVSKSGKLSSFLLYNNIEEVRFQESQMNFNIYLLTLSFMQAVSYMVSILHFAMLLMLISSWPWVSPARHLLS